MNLSNLALPLSRLEPDANWTREFLPEKFFALGPVLSSHLVEHQVGGVFGLAGDAVERFGEFSGDRFLLFLGQFSDDAQTDIRHSGDSTLSEGTWQPSLPLPLQKAL